MTPTLSWVASIGAVSYEYCFDTSNDSTCTPWISTGTNTSVALSDLIGSTTYYWQVHAVNPGGTTDANSGTWWSFTTLPAAPGAFAKSSPANSATNVSLSPTLSWTSSSGVASYEYCYDTVNNATCDASWTPTGTNTSVGLSGLSTSTTYYWQVHAINPGGTTDANSGTWWSFTTLPAAPGAFGKSSPANSATNVSLSPTLSWTSSSGVASYEYCYDTVNNATCDASWTSTGTNTSVALSGLSTSTTYYWQVHAINPGGTTDANSGTWWSFTTLPAAPGAFGKSSPANSATNVSLSPTLSWTSSSGVASYEYCYDTVNNATCDASWTSTGTNTSVALSGLSTSTTYYWQVHAINPGGTTDANSGTWWSFSTVPPAPGAFGKTFPETGALNISTSPSIIWTSSSGATYYESCHDLSDNGTCDGTWTFAGEGTTTGLSSLESGRVYYWQVRAVNAGGTTYANGGTWWSFITVPTFSDVPYSHWAWSWIERLYRSGITTGCNTGLYCPEQPVTRAQMAVFLIRATHGVSFVPPAPTGIFTDVPTTAWAANYIEQLYADGITTGCNPALMLYCPADSVTRAQMAAFLLRAKHGAGYAPPDATGIFSDVPTTYWAAAWIEELYAEGITTGCNTGLYCPEQSVTRAQMAAFLVRTFALP